MPFELAPSRFLVAAALAEGEEVVNQRAVEQLEERVVEERLDGLDVVVGRQDVGDGVAHLLGVVEQRGRELFRRELAVAQLEQQLRGPQAQEEAQKGPQEREKAAQKGQKNT